MPTPKLQATSEIVVAATLWLIHRHRQTGCNTLARLIEQHLRWIEIRAASPQLAAACKRLHVECHALQSGELTACEWQPGQTFIAAA